MLKYAKVINEETGLCDVGIDTNTEFYISIGMEELDVQQSDIDGSWYLTELCPMKTDEQKAKEEALRIAQLSLTKREVFLAIYKDKGISPDQIRSQITDTEALIEFDYAEKYYRGNPLIDVLGAALGYTKEQLDYLFENKELPKVEESEPENE